MRGSTSQRTGDGSKRLRADAPPGVRVRYNRMVRRWAFNILAGLSLVLLAGMVVLWVRSWGVGEAVQVGYWRFHPHPDAASAVAGESVSIIGIKLPGEV